MRIYSKYFRCKKCNREHDATLLKIYDKKNAKYTIRTKKTQFGTEIIDYVCEKCTGITDYWGKIDEKSKKEAKT